MLKVIYTDIDQFSNDDIKSLLPHLSEERRLFALQLKNEKRMRESVVSEALARVGLALAAREFARAGALECNAEDVKASDFEILRKEGGKPYQTTVPGLFFNVSHSGRFCLFAASDSEVGVDIERVGRIKPKNVEAFLSKNELTIYDRFTKEEDKSLVATKYWCRKEAHVKRLGIGLRMRPKYIDTVGLPNVFSQFLWDPLVPAVEWLDGDINGEYCYSICQKKINLGIDKTDRIAQCRLTLNFIKTQDIVVELEKS